MAVAPCVPLTKPNFPEEMYESINWSPALQKALGCPKVRVASPNEEAYAGLCDHVVQQPTMHSIVSMTDLHKRVSGSFDC